MRQRVIWEVVDNTGEGVCVSYDHDEAFKVFMQSEMGVRLVKHRGERIVAEWERDASIPQGYKQLD